MINIDEFRKKPIEIRVLAPGEQAPRITPLKDLIIHELDGNFCTYKELSEKLKKEYGSVVVASKSLEKSGVIVRIVIDGILHVGLTNQVREIGSDKR